MLQVFVRFVKIRPSDATIARFYGLPKIHKPSIPLRPIVSPPGSSTYELSKHLADILQPLNKNSPHSIANANEFLQHIKDLSIEPDEPLVSFDVVSLFTSIPLTTAKRITDELLTSNSSWTNRTLLSKSDILDLLDICLSTDFQFDGSFYKQSAGTPMGNPLSSFLAEAVMQDLENQTLTNDMHIKLWDSYVDDTFSIIKTHHIKKVFDTINNTTDGIIFTMEKEKNGEIAFLDIKLSRTERSIETQVYRKNTHTDQILNYHSNHPTQHKIICIRTLRNRIDTHCNTTETKKNKFDHLQKTFRKNCYPSHFIKSIYNRNQNTANQNLTYMK